MADAVINIEVCCATQDLQQLIALAVPKNTTLEVAVRMAMPDLDVTQCKVGIFGKLKTLDAVLHEHDRIEIYRPLLADPKESRRSRAKR